MQMGTGLPTLPRKMVERIQAGEYITSQRKEQVHNPIAGRPSAAGAGGRSGPAPSDNLRLCYLGPVLHPLYGSSGQESAKQGYGLPNHNSKGINEIQVAIVNYLQSELPSGGSRQHPPTMGKGGHRNVHDMIHRPSTKFRELVQQVPVLRPHLHLTKKARGDIEWWWMYVGAWNSTMMTFSSKAGQPAVTVITDASGSWGCRAFSGQQWFMLPWSGPMKECHITIKELFPIVVAAAVWGKSWKGKVVEVQCDNMAAVVCIVNQGSSKDHGDAMQLRRCLAYFKAKEEFHLMAYHIKGVENILADTLHTITCHYSTPHAAPSPAVIPETVLDLLSQTGHPGAGPVSGVLFPKWPSRVNTVDIHLSQETVFLQVHTQDTLPNTQTLTMSLI